MAILTTGKAMRAAIGLLAGMVSSACAFADTGYAIRSLNTPFADFVSVGDAIALNVTAPTARQVAGTVLRLNGRDVTTVLQPDGTVGSLKGNVPGLKPGANVFELFASKRSKDPVVRLTVMRAISPVVGCATPSGLPPDTIITSVALIADGEQSAAGVPLPQHCRLQGVIEQRLGVTVINPPGGVAPTGAVTRDYGTRFELRMPTLWNGRFLFMGQGGTGGSVQAATGQQQLPAGNAPPLAAGWAVVTFDGGHAGGDVIFGLDAKAKNDFAYHSMDIAAVTAKALITDYYGQGAIHSYFSGCSNGGRQGMMFSQRFPDYFDGIVAGSATYRLSVTYVDSSWGLQQFDAVSPPSPTLPGNPRILANAFSDADLALVANDILKVCDARDGLLDGMVLNTNKCKFRDYDPARLQCTGAKTAACLTPEQVVAMRNIHAGARDSNGDQLYNVWPWDPGIAGPQWRQWKLGSSQTAIPNAIKYSFCSTSVGYLYLTPPEPGFDCLKMNFDVDPARLAQNAWLDAANPDLKAFRHHGGKILWYHGTADTSTPVTEIVRYLRDMTNVTIHGHGHGYGHDRRDRDHGRILEKTSEFARLFVVPGFGHCSGGSAGLDRFDPLTPLVNWVENGIAPEQITATSTVFPGRSRPLCAFPNTAHYKGTGDVENASSFVCAPPQGHGHPLGHTDNHRQ